MKIFLFKVSKEEDEYTKNNNNKKERIYGRED